MTPRMSPDYDLINDSRKSAGVDRELAKSPVDIAALQKNDLRKAPLENLSIRYTDQGNQLAPNVNTALDLL